MVCGECRELVALSAWLHCRELPKQFLYEMSVVAEADGVGLAGNRHRLRLGQYALCLRDVVGPIDVEFPSAYEVEVVPKGLYVFLVVDGLWHLCRHHLHDGLCASQSLIPVGDGDSVVNHVLYFPSILRHDEILTLGIIV